MKLNKTTPSKSNTDYFRRIGKLCDELTDLLELAKSGQYRPFTQTQLRKIISVCALTARAASHQKYRELRDSPTARDMRLLRDITHASRELRQKPKKDN